MPIFKKLLLFHYVVICSVHLLSHVRLFDAMNRSMPGLPVRQQLLESTRTHVHQVDDAIQRSHPLSSPSPPALNLSQHQGPFRWVSSSHLVAKVLEFQLQHQSFHPGLMSFRVDWLDLLAVQGTLESSLTLQFKSINSSVLSFLSFLKILFFSFLYSPILTSIHDHWKNHSLD